MLSLDEAQTRADELVRAALKAGASAADVLYAASRSTGVSMRLGKLEDVERSEGEEIGLRLFMGQRSASVSSSDMSPQALGALVDRAAAMAREAPEDQYAGLAPEELLMRGPPPALDMDDGIEPAPEALRERALAAEDAARAVPGVTNSEGGSASAGRSQVALATSHGFSGAYRSSSHGVSASVLAGEGAGMQRDYASHSARHLADLDDAAEIGRKAGERAVRRLAPIKAPSGVLPVIFDPRISSSLIGHLLGAISGASIARRASFLLDARGTEIFAPGVSILDEPHRPRGQRSKPFDAEGLPTRETRIIDQGVLTTWLLDSASARQLGEQPTGHATRGVGGPPSVSPTNAYMAAGAIGPEELIGDIERGIYVTELIGQGINLVTGDYSRGASGFIVEKGAIGHAIAEFTIAGNLRDMFRHLTPASDLRFRHGINAPTLRVEGMTIAGG